MNKKLVNEINKQIEHEIFSAHLYLAMSAYAMDLDLTGIGNWLLFQSEEERGHALKFISFLQERGERALVPAIEGPKNEFDSVLQVFEESLDHEKFVTSRINELMSIAIEDKDYASVSFLNWFVDEQVEEEASFTAVVNKLKMVGSNPMGLYQLDKELGGRAVAPTPSQGQ